MLNENLEKWSGIIQESLGVDNKSKLNWMAQYAANHEIYEGLQAGDPAAGIYSTPLNTMGMGNPMMPYNTQKPGAPVGKPGGEFGQQTVGSGDIPMSTLTMSLEIAAMTIGLELVPVIPANGPWAMLSYMDFPYAGGKMGRLNETALDGKGEGDANKPIYIKLSLTKKQFAAVTPALAVGDELVIKTKNAAGDAGEFKGSFIGFSRIDAGIILKTIYAHDISGEVFAEDSIANVFDGNYVASVKRGDVTILDPAADTVYARPELVNGAADHVQGFANFSTGSKDPMSRAENETGVGNTIGARMFTRLVQMGSYEVTGTVTRQQLQDMPLYGVDVVGKVLEAMQNEISQHINNRILDRVFKLGIDNAITQKEYQNVDLNLFFGTVGNGSTKDLNTFAAAKYMVDSNESTAWQTGWKVMNATQNTSAENTHTHQRRIMSRCLAAANLIANVSRFGRGQWLVTNTQVLSALQDCSGFIIAPMTNNLTQDGSNSLYFAGHIAGLQVYVDPYMTWDDTRICVGRKSDGNTPGVVFMPYILADTVQITAEGTMAPKMLCNSRFAIVDAGFHTAQNYFTFAVDQDGAYFL